MNDIEQVLLCFDAFLKSNVDSTVKIDFFDNGKIVVSRGKQKLGVVSYKQSEPNVMRVLAKICGLLSGLLEGCPNERRT